MAGVRRIYVEKKPQYKSRELLGEINGFLGVRGVRSADVLIRYDVENVPEDVFEQALCGVFAEPPLDVYTEGAMPACEDGDVLFGVEALPGQYDQRADSAEQAIRLIRGDVQPIVRCATVYRLRGSISEAELEHLKSSLCNPVDSRIITGFSIPDTLQEQYDAPDDVPVLSGFVSEDDTSLLARYDNLSLAMTFEDFSFIRDYFRDTEKRDPSMTEIRVLDTYWSDHCRHTTFATEITDVSIAEGLYEAPIRASYEAYLQARSDLYNTPEKLRNKPVCLMDLATMGMRKLKAEGKLSDMEESGENNACTVIVPVEADYGNGPETEEWLLFFKNETHNHPTEIEPFGGAATCLGGAIRDPLSGRGYVYQAMRVTGAADPTVSLADTLEGKLPQKKIVRDAARGYSSYGNQIGLATGLVEEVYHPDYVAKRMEIGAVLGAAPRKCVKRIEPSAGDVVVLLGGRTGRDGIGGATGSSKAHSESSIETCGAEVQKGNAPTERKIQRLFRRSEVSSLIKKCNDFGAGGVSVAIGELADALEIDLDRVPKKYEGLDGTELAISESQERMAVVLDSRNEQAFLQYAAEENLEAVRVALVTDTGRLVMKWRGKEIVNLSRAFLDTNGVRGTATVRITQPEGESPLRQVVSAQVRDALENSDEQQALVHTMRDLNVCSKRGLAEQFDASIGRATVLMPFCGAYQQTPAQAMVAKLPVLNGETDAASVMSYGFDPYLSSWSPYHGAAYAVTMSVAKLVSCGAPLGGLHFTFQEYFGKPGTDETRWGKPFAALLGACSAQLAFSAAAIGGKDSMSGTFNERDVPPSLVSFAVNTMRASRVITPELKRAGNRIVLFEGKRDAYDLPDWPAVVSLYETVYRLMEAGVIVSCYAADAYGIAAAVLKMAFGNGLGVCIDGALDKKALFTNASGSLVAEIDASRAEAWEKEQTGVILGEVTGTPFYVHGDVRVPLATLLSAYNERMETVYPTTASGKTEAVSLPEAPVKNLYVCKNKVARPRVFIPVLPGTNCEYDLTRAFTLAGADVSCGVFRNLTEEDVRESVSFYEKEIGRAQIVMFPGGFSAGDEPDGSAKFFAVAFRNETVKAALTRLLDERDGLVLGICNGFQAMVKLGLLPSGTVSGQTEHSPTLTYNTIGRHISRMAYLKIVTNRSPWLIKTAPGEVYASPVSHGEGRFVGEAEVLKRLFENGQVATVYSDPDGNVSMDDTWNLNGSMMSVEGVLSPDGRCFGKMAHEERKGPGLMRGIYGEQDMHLFESGVSYFR